MVLDFAVGKIDDGFVEFVLSMRISESILAGQLQI